MQPTTSQPSAPLKPDQAAPPPAPQAAARAPQQVPLRQETELSRIAELGYN